MVYSRLCLQGSDFSDFPDFPDVGARRNDVVTTKTMVKERAPGGDHSDHGPRFQGTTYLSRLFLLENRIDMLKN